MKKIIIIFFLIGSYASNLKAQLDFTFKFGNGTYSMDNLKSLNSHIIQSLPVKAKVVDNFPKTLFFEVDINYNKEYLSFGVSYNYLTTGSRINYTDYSGELVYDQILSANSFGPIVKIILNKTGKVNFKPYLSCKIIGSKYKLIENESVFSQSNGETIELTSTGLIFNFGMEVIYKIKNLGFGVFYGYSVNPDSQLYKGDKQVILDNNEKLYTNWSGQRFGFSFLLEINLNSSFFKPKTIL